MNKTIAEGIVVFGVALFLVVFAIGFVRVDEATWLEWRALWLLGSGGKMGLGIALAINRFV